MTTECGKLAGEDRLAQVLFECLQAVEAGDSAQTLRDRYPEFATEIAEFLADRASFDHLAAPLREAVQAAAGSSAGRVAEVGRTASVPETGQWLGEFELFGVIGRGGTGTVYRARQRSLDRLVALKVIRAGGPADPSDVRRFRAEAEVVAALEHPNIVPVYEVGEQDGLLYLSMRLVEGGSLADRLNALTADARAAARLVAAVARAVHFAHQRGILHRDLKPGNILLSPGRGPDGGGGEWVPLVADFGLAKRVDGDSSLTQSGAIVGTPSYAAPEQASGAKGAVTTAADVWGLGAVLYALLTGRPPFRGETALETLELVRTRDAEPPRQLNPGVDRDLETVCLKCLAKDPGRRYASAAELAEDLERWLAGEPVKARRASRWERTRKWLRRNPALAALLAVVAVSAGAGVAGLVWHNERLRAEAEKVARERDVAQEEQRWAAQAVDDMYTRVAEEWLGSHPRLQPLQREFLEKALEYYQHAAGHWADVPELRRKLPELYRGVGKIQAALGRHDQAEEALRTAVARFEELAAESPTDPVVRNDLVSSQTTLARALQKTGRIPEAITVYRRANDLAAELASDFPDRPNLPIHLLVARAGLAFALAGAGRAEEAERLYRQTLAGLDKLPPPIRDQPNVRYQVANTRNNLGNLYFTAGRFDAAEPHYQQAAAEFERLKTQFPTNTDYLDSWGFSLSNLGATLNRLGRTTEARPALTQAESVLERLAADFPDLPEYPSQLAAIQINLGVVLRKLREEDEAERLYRKAIATQQGLSARFPTVLEYRVTLHVAQSNLGRLLRDRGRLPESEKLLHEAVLTGEKLADESPGVPRYQVVLAETLFNLAITLTKAGKFDGADKAYTRAMGLQQRLLTAEPGNPDYRKAVASTCHTLALLLTWDQDPPYSEAVRAVKLAKRVVDLEPGVGYRWETLGIAQYRAGSWRDCLSAFAQAAKLKLEKQPNHFFKAMAHWHLGEKEAARRHYAVAALWFGQQASPDPKMLRLRNEAAAVLGIGAGPAGTNQKPAPP
jgi:tetratricopeptide (TPR) repeat protein